MSFFKWNYKLNPLVGLLGSMFVMIFGLVMAKTYAASYYFIGVFCWLCIFGCAAAAIKVLPVFLVTGGIFFGVAYASAGGNIDIGFSMVNRFAAIFLAIIPGLATEPVRMTRSLAQIKVPRGLTLGMLIAMSFGPTLRQEIKRVREAMKTRGAGSVLNPKIFYRAFLVPFIMRLVNISDMLALSVETRGFTLGKCKYTIYHKETFVVSDLIYLIGLVAAAVLVVVL